MIDLQEILKKIKPYVLGWVRPVDVMTYGAIGDGVTDDTTAIQAAIDATPSGGTLFFPYTTANYKFYGPLTFSHYINVIGLARAGYVARGCELCNYSDDDGLVFNSCNISGISVIDGYGAGRSAGAGIVVAQESHLQDVLVTGHYDGFRMQRPGTGAYLVELERAYARANLRYGFNAVAGASSGTSLTFIGCYAGENASHGYHIGGSYMYLAFLNTASDSNGGHGYAVTGANPAFSMAISMVSPGAEYNTGDGIYILDASSIVITAAKMLSSGGSGIHLDGPRDVVLLGCDITNSTGYGIEVTTSATPSYPGGITVIGGRIVANTAGAVSADFHLRSTVLNCSDITNSRLHLGFGAVQMDERTAPSAPSAAGVILYAVDAGGGKTKLMALFPSGAAQQVALEP